MELNIIRLGLTDYEKALALQEKLLALRQENKTGDCLLLLEHPPVLTVGKSGKDNNVLMPQQFLVQKGVQVHYVTRGGDVTYHGPGQIVGYPIMDLSLRGRDIKDFIWKLEEVFIRLLGREFGITATREEKKYTGVWTGGSKITAIGVAVRRWVTMHGFAFNVNTNLAHFSWINPCGITDRGVTSLQALTGKKQDFEKTNDLTAAYFCEVFGADPIESKLSQLLKEDS
ncbi:MAG: lipoyl(octanoyl) transferase LipB [Christensenellales bacterium]